MFNTDNERETTYLFSFDPYGIHPVFKIWLLPCNILKLVCITFGNVRTFMKRDKWKRNNS